MRVLGASEIDAVLTWPALIESLAEAFRGSLVAPERHHHGIPRPDGDATLLLMPAWTREGGKPVLGVKVVTVFPGNATRSLPSVQGSYLLMNGETGQPLAVLDGSRLTVWRTAATSALAARLLARPDSRTLAMVGTGALAPFLIRAHGSVRPIDRVLLWGRRREAAEALAATLRAEGLPVEAASDLEEAVGRSDIVSCATLATEPLLRGSWLRPGTHLDLVGAFNMAMREADDEALARARVFIDTRAALHEGGDVAVAIRDGGYAVAAVEGELAAIVDAPPARAPSDITLFKSIGASIEDLAAAELVWRASGAA